MRFARISLSRLPESVRSGGGVTVNVGIDTPAGDAGPSWGACGSLEAAASAAAWRRARRKRGSRDSPEAALRVAVVAAAGGMLAARRRGLDDEVKTTWAEIWESVGEAVRRRTRSTGGARTRTTGVGLILAALATEGAEARREGTGKTLIVGIGGIIEGAAALMGALWSEEANDDSSEVGVVHSPDSESDELPSSE